MKLTRRTLIAAGVAASSAFAQEFYAKPSSVLGAAKGKRVVIIGGGWGGVTAARYLKRANPEIEVVLIEQKPFFMSCPISNLYLAGVKPLNFLIFDYSNLVREGIVFVQERAHSVNRNLRYVLTGSGYINYNYLVLSPGIDYMYEAIKGYDEVKTLMPVGFKPFEHVALRKQLEQFEGGELVMSIPKPPYRCPPGPYERATMLAWMLKANNIKAKLTVLDANPQPLSKAAGFTAAYTELYKDQMQYVPQAEVTAIDHGKKTLTTTLGDFNYDLANIIPPMKAGEIVRQAGLGERWADIQQPYFMAKTDDRVYLIGDIVGGTPYPKSGQTAFNQGRIIADHIAGRIGGKPSSEIPWELPENICYSFVDSDQSIWVSHEHDWDSGAKQIKQVSRSDQTRSKQNGDNAIKWATGLWSDMFGRES